MNTSSEIPTPSSEENSKKNLFAETQLSIDKIDSNENHIIKSVNEAQLLLRYMVKNGKDLDENTILTIVKARQFIDIKQWPPEFETKFWQAFNTLAQKTIPVSVDSLKMTRSDFFPETNPIFRLFRKFKKPASVKKVNLYGNMTFFFLILMLVVQIYAVVGTSLVKDIKKATQEIQEINDKTDKRLQQIIEASPNKLDAKKLQTYDPEITHLDFLRATSSIERETDQNFLEQWSLFISKDRNNTLKSCLAQKQKKELNEVNDLNYSSEHSECLDIVSAPFVKAANFLLDILYSYILPLLYGLLGSLAYVLRTLSTEIKTLTYTYASDINYMLRLHLGTLSGLAIGWFFIGSTSAETSAVATLSPLALAFLTGYSVEILFTLMDKIVAAFSGSLNLQK